MVDSAIKGGRLAKQKTKKREKVAPSFWPAARRSGRRPTRWTSAGAGGGSDASAPPGAVHGERLYVRHYESRSCPLSRRLRNSPFVNVSTALAFLFYSVAGPVTVVVKTRNWSELENGAFSM